MPGWLTNGMVPVGPATQNGVTLAAPNGTYPHLSPRSLVPVDTETVSGTPPQSVAVTAAGLAMLAASYIKNNATSTAGAATLNTTAGLITTEALTTAVGGTYTFTLTNSVITATSPAPIVDAFDGTNNAGGNLSVTSVAVAAGSATFTFVNNGTAALNGTMLLAFRT